jgi:hypothetical protein
MRLDGAEDRQARQLDYQVARERREPESPAAFDAWDAVKFPKIRKNPHRKD